MNELDVLKEVEKILSEEQLSCTLVEANEDISIPRLLVYLGFDYQGRERILTIVAQDQLLFDNPQAGEGAKFHYVNLQFLVELPFKVSDEAIDDVTSTICFINSMSELPGFEFLDLEESLRYRSVLIIAKEVISKALLLSITGGITILLNIFTEMLERIATGQSTFADLVESILKSAKENPPKSS